MSEHAQSESPSDPDGALVARAREALEGDTRAFERLVRRHQSWVLSNCRHLTRLPSDAPDLAQEVFLKAFFGLRRFEGRSSFKSWIGRIKVNHCLNHLRKGASRGEDVEITDPALVAEEALQTPAEGDRVLRGLGERQRIEAVLDSLPDTLRIPLLLCDLDGMEYAEIAENLGIGLSATKMRIKRGREEFRRRYRELEASDA